VPSSPLPDHGPERRASADPDARKSLDSSLPHYLSSLKLSPIKLLGRQHEAHVPSPDDGA